MACLLQKSALEKESQPASMSIITSPEHPIVSIVLPVKNGSDYINKAIDSILAQTFTNFELIVIDDGSDDNTAQIVRAYDDPRIILICQENQGVSRASNRGFELSRGKYITRHDHDDLSMPTRIEKQVKFLETHPECSFVGTWAQIWVGDKPTDRVHRHPTSSGQLAFALLFNSPFVHSSCLYRKEVFNSTGGYTGDSDRVPPEDYEYFSRISRGYPMANIPEVLVVYREVSNSMSSMLRSNYMAAKAKFIFNLARISAENLAYVNNLNSINSTTEEFGQLIHHGLNPHQYVNIQEIKKLVNNAADRLAIRFNDPSIQKMRKEMLLFLDYQYHTHMGNTLHHSRLQYLFLNRPWHENMGSVSRLMRRMVSKLTQA